MVVVVHEDKLSAVLSEFARTLVTDFPIQGILDHLVERIVEVLPVTAAGVTLISAGHGAALHRGVGRRRRCASSSCRPSVGQGPCLPAYESGRGRRRPGPARRRRGSRGSPRRRWRPGWPRCSPSRCATATAGSARWTSTATRPGALDPHDMGAAQTLADVAAAYLLNAQAREEARATSDRSTTARCTTR